MKLATYKDGSRDGQLVVVSRDLSAAHYATDIAHRLQQALDDWNFIAPQLQDLYDSLNQGKARHAFAFDAAQCMAPLPRAYQWLTGSAYPFPTEPAHAADRAAEPRLHQGSSDVFLGPRDAIRVADEALDIDFGAQLAAITGDVPMGATPEQGLDAIRLLMLVNAVHLHKLGPDDVRARPATTFGPVAVTPDELGDAWVQGRPHLTIQISCNGRKVGLIDAGTDMRFHFGQLIGQAARTRRVSAGSIIGSGVVRHVGTEKNGRIQWPKGYACIADKRAMETQEHGAPKTGYLKFDDSVRIEARGKSGESTFGSIEQVLTSG